MPTKIILLVPFLAVLARDTETGFAAQFFDPSWSIDHRGFLWSAIVIVLFLSGCGLPLPEDVPLTLSGFTTTKLQGDELVFSAFVVTFLVVVVPILAGVERVVHISSLTVLGLPRDGRVVG